MIFSLYFTTNIFACCPLISISFMWRKSRWQGNICVCGRNKPCAASVRNRVFLPRYVLPLLWLHSWVLFYLTDAWRAEPVFRLFILCSELRTRSQLTGNNHWHGKPGNRTSNYWGSGIRSGHSYAMLLVWDVRAYRQRLLLPFLCWSKATHLEIHLRYILRNVSLKRREATFSLCGWQQAGVPQVCRLLLLLLIKEYTPESLHKSEITLWNGRRFSGQFRNVLPMIICG